MMTKQEPQPHIPTIKADLEHFTRRWGELKEPLWLELRCLPSRAHQKFRPDDLDGAANWAAIKNRTGEKIYAVRNPIKDATPPSQAARDEDIAAAFFLWADCDDDAATENVRHFDGPKCTAVIQTGKIPSQRVHIYWELEDPCRNLDAWEDMQKRIAAHFKSDRVVVNPARIMRVAGTISWPDERKRGKGYVPELTVLRTDWPEDREPLAFERALRVWPAASSTHASASTIDTGPAPLDRERTRIQALSGQEWHNSVIRLVGSYVSKGLSDAEIHGLTDPLTLQGYTVEQTRQEVQTAIEGARAKGWAPPQYAEPAALDFDPPAPAPVSSSLEWFDDIQPALSAAYLIKGVIDAEAMSVVYGPSNSGKTFFAIDLAFHVATGAEWRGRRVHEAGVLYLAAEGGRGVINRIAALRAQHGICDVPLALRRAGLDLLRKEADLQHIADLAAEVRARAGSIGLLVIDTLSRVMAGGDENSAADMTAFIRNVDALRQHIGCHVMIVHHTGKDTARGARGHSSLRAATDTEIEVQNEDGQRAALVTKQRDHEGGQAFDFELLGVPLGHDQDGDEVTSAVVSVPENGGERRDAARRSKGLGGNQKIIADTFEQMLGEGLGKPNPGGVGMPEPGQFWCVPMEDLKHHARAKMVAGDTRSSFNKAMRALIEDRKLFVSGENVVWRVDRKVRQ